MLETGRSYVANSTRELGNMKGEVVKGVIVEKGETTLIFESGFGFTFTPQGSNWIEQPLIIKNKIRNKLGRLKDSIRELDETLNLAGETADIPEI